MSLTPSDRRCVEVNRVTAYALGALSPSETATMAAHVAVCWDCRRELEALGPTIELLTKWQGGLLYPPSSLWDELVERIAGAADQQAATPAVSNWREPDWEEVAPGICCKLLASDAQRDRVSMLVRLAPGVAYPPHRHAGVEELHLLQGELWIEDRKLVPGDYNRAAPGTADERVWSQTGCTCVLITSPSDVLG
jgi:anti-sigma factor ChrR (cupin superfamily)